MLGEDEGNIDEGRMMCFIEDPHNACIEKVWRMGEFRVRCATNG
jgi:hypothetical protein